MNEHEDALQFAGDYRLREVLIKSSRNIELDFRSLVLEMNIFEDIFSNSMYGNIIIRDSANHIENLPIIGQEDIRFKFETPGFNDPIDFEEHAGKIYKVDKQVRTLEREQLYVLHFTTKEALIHDSAKLNIKAGEGTYTEIQDKARTTTNETLAVKDVYRNIGGVVYKTVAYSTDLVAKTTTKETTIHKTEGFLGGILEGLFGGYLSSKPFAKDTNKQSTHNEYIGSGNTNVKEQMSHLATDNAEIDGTREKILIDAGHIPNGGQSSLSKINNGSINMKSNKSIVESLAPRKMHNVEKVYQATPNSNVNGITKESSQLNSYENRLDKDTLSSLKNNPFNIQVNPI